MARPIPTKTNDEKTSSSLHAQEANEEEEEKETSNSGKSKVSGVFKKKFDIIIKSIVRFHTFVCWCYGRCTRREG